MQSQAIANRAMNDISVDLSRWDCADVVRLVGRKENPWTSTSQRGFDGSFYERPPKGTPWEVLGEHPCFVHFPKSPNQAECSVFRSEGAH